MNPTRPYWIKPKDWQEWLDSGVGAEIIAANVRSLEGTTPLDYLLYSPKLERRNDGRLVSSILRKYAPLENGGWWCGTQKPVLSQDCCWEVKPSLWGGFKPHTPRPEFKKNDRTGQWKATGKIIKYEQPPKVPTEIFLLDVPSKPRLWLEVLCSENQPIIITEGAKKAGCLLTLGYIAIALPGVTGAVRTRDENGDKIPAHLIPEIEAFAKPGREFYICFDQDAKPTTRQNVEREIFKLARLLRFSKCKVRVIGWDPQLGKGVDDFIASHGPDAFHEKFDQADLFEWWALKKLARLSYKPSVALNSRYFPDDIEIPINEKLVAIKGVQGTGKSHAIAGAVKAAKQRGQRVLLLSHRVQLCGALCKTLGILSIHKLIAALSGDKSESAGKWLRAKREGYGLTIDSAHRQSQAHFRAEDWKDALIIIDEVEQVLSHLFSSSTCTEDRIAILREIRDLIRAALDPESEGRIIVADADLSDISIDFIKETAEQPFLQPWLYLNEYRGSGYQAYHHPSPEDWLKHLEGAIASGKRIFVCTDSQRAKGRFSSSTLEKRLKKQFPSKKILRTDSQTLQRKDHPAFGQIANLKAIASGYDIIIASPSLETGISLDLRGHFDAVYGIFQGTLADNSVRQALARLREPVDRHIFVASMGLGLIGAGETYWKHLEESAEKEAGNTIKLILEAARDEGIESQFFPAATHAWAKFAARSNAGKLAYRDIVLASLAECGHKVTRIEQGMDSESMRVFGTELNIERDLNRLESAIAISSAKTLDDTTAELMQKKESLKNEAEQHQLLKWQIQKRYGIEITPDLVLLNESGWYRKIRLHYYLTQGRHHLKERDKAKIEGLLGDRNFWAPDINRSALSLKVAILEHFGVPALLQKKQFRNSDDELLELAEEALLRQQQIKQSLGFKIARNDSPIQVAKKFLDCIGFNLTCTHREGGNNGKGQVRIYELQRVDSLKLRCEGESITYSCDRQRIFDQWLERDRQRSEAVTSMEEMYPLDTFVVRRGNDLSYSPALTTNVDYKDLPTAPPVPEMVGAGEADCNREGIPACCDSVVGRWAKWGSSLSLWLVEAVEGDRAWVRRAGATSRWYELVPLSNFQFA